MGGHIKYSNGENYGRRVFQWGENPIGGKTLHFYTTVVVVVTGVVIDVVNNSLADVLKLSIVRCVSVVSIILFGCVFGFFDVVVEVSDVLVNNFVNCSVDVFIE